MRRKILKPEPMKPTTKPDAGRLAAIRAHLTRNREALRRWQRRLKRATSEYFKYLDKTAHYEGKLEKELA